MTVDQINWKSWKPEEKASLCFILNENKILLINKKTGLGAGKVNGPGGRLNTKETDLEAAIRETKEEVCITPEKIKKAAELSFIFTNGFSLFCSVFIAKAFKGKATETVEALPFWCSIDKIPYHKMWDDDILWLPEILSGKYIKGFFIIDEKEKVKSYRLLR